MGAKQTSQLIPLCHSISLNQVSVKLMLDRDGLSINIWARARTFGKTGKLLHLPLADRTYSSDA